MRSLTLHIFTLAISAIGMGTAHAEAPRLCGLELASQLTPERLRHPGEAPTVCTLPHDPQVAIWRPEGPGQPLLAVRQGSARPLIIEVPHPFFDEGTLAIGQAMFHRLNARALLISGAHRCSDARYAACDGTTHVCGTSGEGYRRSDVAHSVETDFHQLHIGLTDAWPDHKVISVHAMARDGISVSDGTLLPVRRWQLIPRLTRQLVQRYPGVHISACNPFAEGPFAPRLCGTTNVQGRHLNGVSNACHAAATESSGRFIHLEMGPEVRLAPGGIIRALGHALPWSDPSLVAWGRRAGEGAETPRDPLAPEEETR